MTSFSKVYCTLHVEKQRNRYTCTLKLYAVSTNPVSWYTFSEIILFKFDLLLRKLTIRYPESNWRSLRNKND